MDTKEDTEVKTAPQAPAMPAPVVPGPGKPGAVPWVPLQGPVDMADNSLERLQSAFRALPIEEPDTNPVKERGRERRMQEKAWQTKEWTMGTMQRACQPSRAHQAPLASTHHPLLHPPHFQLQTQLLQHPHA